MTFSPVPLFYDPSPRDHENKEKWEYSIIWRKNDKRNTNLNYLEHHFINYKTNKNKEKQQTHTPQKLDNAQLLELQGIDTLVLY